MSIQPLRPPLMVHHMAALDGHSAPPNSVEVIRACLEDGATFIEIDVNALADSDYLLVHGPQLAEETTGVGIPEHYTSAQARDLFIRTPNGVTPFHVPQLSDVVALFGQYPGQTQLQIDFKDMMPMPTDEPLHRLVNIIEPLGERVIVSTGADWQLRKLRRLAPWLKLGFDIHLYIDWRRSESAPPDQAPPPYRRGAYGYWDDQPLATKPYWKTAQYLADRCEMLIGQVPNISIFYMNHEFLAQSLEDGFNWARGLHEAGIRCDAYTLDISDPRAVTNARHLFEAGVDQFTTNTPEALGKLLNGA